VTEAWLYQTCEAHLLGSLECHPLLDIIIANSSTLSNCAIQTPWLCYFAPRLSSTQSCQPWESSSSPSRWVQLVEVMLAEVW
jgi:hypothetical protein